MKDEAERHQGEVEHYQGEVEHHRRRKVMARHQGAVGDLPPFESANY